MKSKFLSFLAGAFTVLVLASLPASSLASNGSLSLKVFPIRVLVNGQVFQPKDANGQNALIFTYNGTTYAPLRALAETYGLNVGYDPSVGVATVSAPAYTSPAADPFASVWTIKERPASRYGNEKIYTALYSGSLNMSEFQTWWKSLGDEKIAEEAEKLAAEAQRLNPGDAVTLHFSYGAYNLGSAFACDDFQQSNFSLASAWIR